MEDDVRLERVYRSAPLFMRRIRTPLSKERGSTRFGARDDFPAKYPGFHVRRA